MDFWKIYLIKLDVSFISSHVSFRKRSTIYMEYEFW